MRILIVGNGGREHALLWKLRKDHPGAHLFATRPNGGMAELAEAVEIAPTDVEALAGWAASRAMDLTVVGPEGPLALGLSDRLRKQGLPVFGPSRSAIRIESSKAFAKDLMRGAGVPTAAYRTFSELDTCEAYIRERGAPIVVKASGLAAGKGAVVCTSVEEALDAARSMLGDLAFGEAGREVVVEEFMEGEEISLFGITDGTDVVLLLPSQDHKRVGEGDQGPNTGGMGAYAPVSIATPELLAEARDRVFLPTLRALADADAPFQGLLYAGLMVTPDGLKVVEFNGRFGDPETQVVLPMLKSSLLELLVASAEGRGLGTLPPPVWRSGAALTTVVASGGYPGDYEKGKAMDLSDVPTGDDTLVFHAGTARKDGALVTSGGRVLAVTGLGDTLAQAAERSRAGASGVRFQGSFYRNDIGWRELARQS
ncbi:MAG TPA: phosphoribosylamine--glycine ligase [Longimicrobiales bacterium]|nr:phosphoribosylamine--glycine ligase [Longimicrobiales bacterium]